MDDNRNLPANTASQSVQQSDFLRMSDPHDLIPVTPEQFAAEMTPCLALVGASGMSDQDRREWMNAAFKTLQGIPIGLLKRGAQAARGKADHPSKIVVEVMKEIGDVWERRKANVTNATRQRAAIDAQASANTLPSNHEPCTPEDAAEALKRYWPTMAEHEPGYVAGALNLDPDRPCRKPTREDYIRLGVDPSTLDGME